jgi:ribosomal protein S12 methylthiotransferase
VKIGFVSLGCPKNLVDSEVMMGLAAGGGHELTSDPAGAQVLVVNTCAFIDSAKQESVDAILEMAAYKQHGSCRRLVVTGCLAERYRDELAASIPEIDAVLGTGDVPAIVDAIEGRQGLASPVRFFRSRNSAEGLEPGGAPAEAPRSGPTYIYDAETPRLLATPRHLAYVKVAEGCDYQCAFCIIPTLRGHYRSRPIDSIVREVEALAARGVREIVLVSQDTTFYGVDRGERGALARLLRRLDAVDRLARIRLLYLYPTTVTDETLAAMAECDRVCKYVDMPLQHASAEVLRRMKRPGDRRTYDRLLARIRDRVPGVAIRTTFIVGFPGESEAEFAELERFVDETAFDHVGVFTYSHEEGTAAHALADEVPARVKRRRRSALMARQKRIVQRAQRRRLGTRVEVLIDGLARESELVLTGRLATQAPEIDPLVYLDGADPSGFRPGELVEAEITGARGYDLVARPLREGSPIVV